MIDMPIMDAPLAPAFLNEKPREAGLAPVGFAYAVFQALDWTASPVYKYPPFQNQYVLNGGRVIQTDCRLSKPSVLDTGRSVII
jgi:hypothetical protein